MDARANLWRAAMHWILLLIAIAGEVSGTTSMKLSEGWTRLWPSLGVVAGYTVSTVAITFALKRIELSVAYAIWAGVGVTLTAVIGLTVFREQVTAFRLLGLLLTVIGVICLRLSSKA